MKPAREPASNLPKSRVSLRKPHEYSPFSLSALVGRKQTVVKDFPSETSRFAPCILAPRASSVPGANLVLTHRLFYPSFRGGTPVLVP